MHQLVSKNGILSGLLFDRNFDISPLFSGNAKEYEQLFQDTFVFKEIALAKNSIAKTAGTELFLKFYKNTFIKVNLYHFEGITCSGCKNTVTSKCVKLMVF